MTSDSGLFRSYEQMYSQGFRITGNAFVKDTTRYLPLYEAKLVHQFNHRAATFQGVQEDSRFKTHAWADDPSAAQLEDAAYQVWPRFWISESDVESVRQYHGPLVAFRNAISTVADSRTFVASTLPACGVGNSMPISWSETLDGYAAVILSLFNSIALDYIVRQKASGGNLNFYVVKQLPLPNPDALLEICSWSPLTSTKMWLTVRVLDLTYTAWDIEGFALDCGYDGPPFRWDEERRFLLRCELDAAYFHLYLGASEEWGNDSPQLREMFPTPRHAVEYIMETFPIVKRKDIKRHGDYRTKLVILDLYDQMQQAMESGSPFHSQLDPPAGPPTDSEGNFIPMADWDLHHWPSHIHPPRDPIT